MRIAVTGMGIISAIGTTTEQNLEALIAGDSGISDLKNIDTILKGVLKFGEIKLSNSELAQLLGVSNDNYYSRTTLLGLYAAKNALSNAGITDINDYPTALVSSTSVGGMDIKEKYFFDFFEKPELLPFVPSLDGSDTAHKIADAIGLNGLVTTTSTACSSAANAIIFGAKLISSGRADRVIVGGSDALAVFTINGFNTLMILTDTFNAPFDNDRKGLNLGEAAAYLVLESDRIIQDQNKKALAYLTGFGNANDAFHQTASSEEGDGAYLAMNKAIKMAGINKEEIDYINVHGTATPNNDLSEGRALNRTFGNQVPMFSSTKPFTGHTLAAAAAIEAVYSVLAIQNNVIFPNLNFKTKMEEIDAVPVTQTIHKEVNVVLSNSFGFGGNCSSLIFSKH